MGRKLAGDEAMLNEAFRLCRSAARPVDMRMALSIILPGRAGLSLPETAEIIGVGQATVSRMRKKFLSGERPGLGGKSGWGGRRRANLSENEERQFIGKWAAVAEKGNLKTLDAVCRDYLRIAGTKSPKSTIHVLVKKYGWVKIRSAKGSKIWTVRDNKCPK